jgi:sugar/nucleoside kinase (ribokinase family)
MLRKTATLAIAAALGTGSAIGIAACGEDREGEVTIEDGGGTDTSGTGTETGATTGTTATETTPETTPTETSP